MVSFGTFSNSLKILCWWSNWFVIVYEKGCVESLNTSLVPSGNLRHKWEKILFCFFFIHISHQLHDYRCGFVFVIVFLMYKELNRLSLSGRSVLALIQDLFKHLSFLDYVLVIWGASSPLLKRTWARMLEGWEKEKGKEKINSWSCENYLGNFNFPSCFKSEHLYLFLQLLFLILYNQWAGPPMLTCS